MQLHDSPEFVRFAERRQQLNSRLDETRDKIDQMVAAYQSDSPIVEIAALEGVLIERRDILKELATLDDNFIGYLLLAREHS
jgi:hypothetical protein